MQWDEAARYEARKTLNTQQIENFKNGDMLKLALMVLKKRH
ncbi:hypothetical protein RV10_GL002627 [Enterococcus pallens]|nr:hypothetical protein RV10_GL002627 [Enterococcus pallens]